MGCSTLRSNLIKINVRAAEESYPHGRTRAGSTTANKMQIQIPSSGERVAYVYAYRGYR